VHPSVNRCTRRNERVLSVIAFAEGHEPLGIVLAQIIDRLGGEHDLYFQLGKIVSNEGCKEGQPAYQREIPAGTVAVVRSPLALRCSTEQNAPRMPCRRSAASALISRFKTRSHGQSPRRAIVWQGAAERSASEVQKRREWPTKVIQAIQVVVQKRIISRVLGGTGEVKPPWFLRLFIYFPNADRTFLSSKPIEDRPLSHSSANILERSRFPLFTILATAIAVVIKNRAREKPNSDHSGDGTVPRPGSTTKQGLGEAGDDEVRRWSVIDDGRNDARAEAPSLLAGLIVDADGNRMTPSHAKKSQAIPLLRLGVSTERDAHPSG
jgi:hypothetical protein